MNIVYLKVRKIRHVTIFLALFLFLGQSAQGLTLEEVYKVQNPGKVLGTTTVIFQQGVNGYSGVRDTYLETETWGSPAMNTLNFGQSDMFELNRDGRAKPLVKFDVTSISSGSIVQNAQLKIYNSTASTVARRVNVYLMLKNWDEGNQDGAAITASGRYGATADNAFSYYAGQGTNIPWGSRGMQSGVDYQASLVGYMDVTGTGWYQVELGQQVQNWISNSSANYGVALMDASGYAAGDNDLRDFYSSQYSNASLRPQLSVTYDTVGGGDATAPTVPASLSATAVSSSAINLSWSASTDNVGVTGYKIYRGGTQVGTSATNSYSDTGLSASTQYTYTVSAYDAAGNTSAQSLSASATTQVQAGDTQAPTTPANLSATAVSSSQINLSWTASTDNIGVTGYRVYRGGTQVGTAVTNSYSDASLSASTQYSYAVSAFDSAGNSSVQSSPASATTQAQQQSSGSEYHVGPGQAYASIGAVPWKNLKAGETVYIHAKANQTPYYERVYISASLQGTQTNPIRIIGVSDGSGNQPILDGANSATGANYDAYGDPQYHSLLGLVVFGPKAGAYGSAPQWVEVSNLTLRNYKNVTTSDENNAQHTNTSGACIYLQGGQHVTLDQLTITGCQDGIFAKDNEFPVKWITLRRSYIYNNGVSGDYLYHNIYTEAAYLILEYNHFGPPASGSPGNNIKDRGVGTVIRYNWVEDGGHLLDLVECQDNCVAHSSDPAWQEAFVYGNIFYSGKDGASQLFHFGSGDFGANQAYWRKKLYFYDNTVVTTKNQSDAYYMNLFQVSGTGQSIWLDNNIFYTAPRTAGQPSPEVYLQYDGSNTATAYGNMTIGKNWISPGWTVTKGGVAVTGTVTGTENLISPTGNNPYFTNSSTGDYTLTPGSAAISASGVLPAIISSGNSLSQNLTPTNQYVKHQSFATRPNLNDLGAFASGSSTPPPTSDTTAPTVPTNLTATTISTSAINLSWSASTDNVGVVGYKIYRGGTQIGTSATASYSDTGLTAGTLYSYSVLAYDTAGNTSSQSSPASATTQAVLPQISNLLGANTTATTTTISWNTNVPTNGQVFYGLSTSYGSQSSLLDNTTKTTTHIATLSSLTPSTLYHFKVTSIDSLSNSTSSPDFTFTTLALPVPPAPTISSFISNPSSISSGGSSTLSWTTTNSTQLTINNGVGAVTPVIGSGSKSVSPTQTTTYTLTATNGTATATAQTVVTIGSVVVSTSTPPAITSFTSDSSAITSGQPGVLSWVVTGSPSPTVTIDNGVGDVTSMSSKSVSPTANTTYTLTATNSAGTATAQVTLTVNPAPVVTPPGGGGGGGGGGGSGGTPSGTPSAPTVTYIPPASTVTTPASGTSSGALKLINISGTYYLISNGQRHGITNPGMLNSYGFSLSDAKPATETEKALPEGSLLLPGDGSLVKSKQDQTVYLISQGQRYGFTSAAVFTSLGFKFSSVLVVTDPELQALPKASQLLNNGTAAHLPGLDINRNGTVYWIGGDNTLHGYPSLAVYNSWHIANDFSRVVPANSADNSLPVGDLVQGRVVN